MKSQELFFLLSNAKSKQEFIRILRTNRIPLTIAFEEISHETTNRPRNRLIEKKNKK